jgi:hypothetical protein
MSKERGFSRKYECNQKIPLKIGVNPKKSPGMAKQNAYPSEYSALLGVTAC